MLRKLMILIMASLVANLGYMPAAMARDTQKEKDAKHAERVKKQIEKLGVGRDSWIEIRLKDKTVVKGYISETADDHFVITAQDTGVQTNVTYGQVDKVRFWSLVKAGMRQTVSSPGGFLKKFGIATAIGVGTLMAVCLISRRCAE